MDLPVCPNLPVNAIQESVLNSQPAFPQEIINLLVHVMMVTLAMEQIADQRQHMRQISYW